MWMQYTWQKELRFDIYHPWSPLNTIILRSMCRILHEIPKFHVNVLCSDMNTDDQCVTNWLLSLSEKWTHYRSQFESKRIIRRRGNSCGSSFRYSFILFSHYNVSSRDVSSRACSNFSIKFAPLTTSNSNPFSIIVSYLCKLLPNICKSIYLNTQFNICINNLSCK